jgi:hypothetical protein
MFGLLGYTDLLEEIAVSQPKGCLVIGDEALTNLVISDEAVTNLVITDSSCSES